VSGAGHWDRAALRAFLEVRGGPARNVVCVCL
jgi:hypothetical protein